MGLSLERILLALAVAIMAFAAVLAGPRPAKADHLACHAPLHGWGFDTYEFEDYAGKYGQIIDLAVNGMAVPSTYAVGDETIDVTYQGLESGPRSARQPASKSNTIPPSIYKAIAYIEADWSNATYSVVYGGTGPTLTSLDCGYGIGQITTGMGYFGGGALEPGVPAARQALIGTDPLFNIAEGVRILADKWNGAPGHRPIAGEGNPASLEDWYYGIWSYNGFAFSNHPLNPTKDPLRGSVWNCGDPNAPGYGYFTRSDYTYTENVYGCVRYPPMPKGVAYPPPLSSGNEAPPAPVDPNAPKFVPGDTAVVYGTGNGLRIRQTPGTAGTELTVVPDGTKLTVLGGPQDADGLTWWNIQYGDIVGWSAGQFLAKPLPEPDPDAPVNPAGRMWLPQVFSMPNLASPEIATAFAIEAFNTCSDEDFEDGCAAMDFPTTPHFDSTPAPDPGGAAYFLGSPVLQINGARTVNLTAESATATSSPVTIKNLGTALAPFRVRTTADWLIVRHASDPRHIDGGVAIGSNYEVVDQKVPRIATAGRDSELQITVDPRFLTAGTHTGTITIDSLLGPATSATFSVTVVSTGGGGAGGEPPATPASQSPTPVVHKAVLPNLSSEGGY
ncbi:MAG: SH3 domain-containing protein [Dehalococcoidia bacterium]